MSFVMHCLKNHPKVTIATAFTSTTNSTIIAIIIAIIKVFRASSRCQCMSAHRHLLLVCKSLPMKIDLQDKLIK